MPWLDAALPEHLRSPMQAMAERSHVSPLAPGDVPKRFTQLQDKGRGCFWVEKWIV